MEARVLWQGTLSGRGFVDSLGMGFLQREDKMIVWCAESAKCALAAARIDARTWPLSGMLAVEGTVDDVRAQLRFYAMPHDGSDDSYFNSRGLARIVIYR